MFFNRATLWLRPLTNALIAAALYSVVASPHDSDGASAAHRPTGGLDFAGNNGDCRLSLDHSLGEVENIKLVVNTIQNNDGVGSGSDSYTQYNGDGTYRDGWPARGRWVSFVDMFHNNQPLMFSSCHQFKQIDDYGFEVAAIYDSIQQIALETHIDHRFILAIIMQESGGCVRAPTTSYGVKNPGLMQDHDGAGTCNGNGRVQMPCPRKVIARMIRDGSAGTDAGDGLAQCINKSNASDTAAFYKAARIYNSGSMDVSGDLGQGVATHCYASDIANRLTGWVHASHKCTLDG